MTAEDEDESGENEAPKLELVAKPAISRIEFWFSDPDKETPEKCDELIGISGDPFKFDKKDWDRYIQQVMEFIPCFQDQWNGIKVRITMTSPDNLELGTPGVFISEVFDSIDNGSLRAKIDDALIMPYISYLNRVEDIIAQNSEAAKSTIEA